MTFVWNWYFELGSSLTAFGIIRIDLTNACSLFQIRVDFLGDMIRSTCFSVILRYFCKYEKISRVPVEYVTLFQEFIKDFKCCSYFHKFLEYEGKQDLEPILTEFILDVTIPITEVRETEVIIVPAQLESAFERFKKTRSFWMLRQELRIASEVEALGLRKIN